MFEEKPKLRTIIANVLAHFSVPKKVEEDASLHRFGPFMFAYWTFFLSTAVYIGLECWPIESTSWKEAYAQFKNHPYLMDSTKLFLAITALLVAWHRSLVVDHQTKIDKSSKNIDIYFKFKDRIDTANNEISTILSSEKKLLTKKIQHNKNTKELISNIFRDPANGDYSISKELSNNIELLVLQYNRLINELSFIKLLKRGPYWSTLESQTIALAFHQRVESKYGFSRDLKIPSVESIKTSSERIINLCGFNISDSIRINDLNLTHEAVVFCLKSIKHISEDLPLRNNFEKSIENSIHEIKESSRGDFLLDPDLDFEDRNKNNIRFIELRKYLSKGKSEEEIDTITLYNYLKNTDLDSYSPSDSSLEKLYKKLFSLVIEDPQSDQAYLFRKIIFNTIYLSEDRKECNLCEELNTEEFWEDYEKIEKIYKNQKAEA